jgi:peptidyl-tRNA hydrolase
MLTTVTVDYFEELRKEADIEIIDAGHTEVKPGTCTIIAFIPDYKEKIGPKFKGLPKYTGK